VLYEPYFYVAVSDVRYVQEAATTLRRRYDEHGMTVTAADKEDLDMPNHLSGKLRRYLRLSFTSVASLQEVCAVFVFFLS
jgi:DNA polymerase epsilon subunit 1